MKRTLILASVTVIAMGSAAIAAEGKDKKCHTLDEVKASVPGSKVSILNAGQFHFLEGAYIVLPPPSGLPKADGAALVQVKGKGGALVVWTIGKTPVCVADAQPMPIADRFVPILKSINPTQGEMIDDVDGDDELHL